MKVNPEILIRTILGPVRGNVLSLAFAVQITAEQLFQQRISIDDLQFTKDIYRTAAKLTNADPRSATRQIERLAGRCQDKLFRKGLAGRILGESVSVCDIESPRMLIIYLAVYAYLGMPFETALVQHPELFIGQAPAVPSLP